MTQEELIKRAIKETFKLLHMPCALDVLATEAIKTYIKLKNTEDVNTEVNESDIEKVVQKEYTESKHDCGDIPQDEWASTPKSKVDNLADRLVSSKIRTREEEAKVWEKYFTDKYGGNNWYEALCNKTNSELDEENKRITQWLKDKESRKTKEGLNEGLSEGTDEGLLSSHATTPITTTTPTTPTTNTTHSSHLHHSSNGHLLKITKKYPHRINQLQLLHNKHRIQQLSEIKLTQGVSILECDIIWNDDVWSDEHIVPYNVAVYEGKLAKYVDNEVGFQFYSFSEMYDYLEWKPNQDFTIVRIRDYYTTVNK